MFRPTKIQKDTDTKAWYFIDHNSLRVSNASSLVLFAQYTSSLESYTNELEKAVSSARCC